MSRIAEFLSGFAEGFFGNASNGAAQSGPAGNRIERLCGQLGWSVDEKEGITIRLHFRDPLVGIRKLTVISNESPLVFFRSWSHAVCPAEHVPRDVLGYLLRRNKDLNMAAWTIDVSDDGHAVFAVHYCALADGLSATFLKHICESMIREAAEFDKKMHEVGLLRPR